MPNTAQQAEYERLDVLLRGDAEALAGMLDDNFLYVHGTGKLDTKSSYVEAISSGDLKYIKIETEDMSVQTSHEVTILLYNFRTVRTRGVEAPVEFYRRVLAVWHDVGGTYKLIALCMTDVG